MVRPAFRAWTLAGAGFASAAALAFSAGAARADGPPAQEGPDPQAMEELKQISIRISKSLKDNEEALARLARGEEGAPTKVDIKLPEESNSSKTPKSSPSEGGGSESTGGGGSSGGEKKGGASEALRSSSEQGRSVSKDIEEFLKIASKMGKPQHSDGGGGGGSGGDPSEGQEGKDRNGKKGPEEKKDPLKDDKPGGGEPKSGETSKEPPEKKHDASPPKSDKAPPPVNDLKGIFLARLPDKVREAVLNGDFDQVPEKYRDLVSAWTKALGEAESAKRAGEGGR